MKQFILPILMGATGCMVLVASALALSLVVAHQRENVELLHASFDSSREILQAWHESISSSPLAAEWDNPHFRISNTSSAAQARSVRDGLPADIVSLNFEPDWQILAKAGLVHPDWRSQLPGGKAPWYASLVLIVRKGNPYGIKDWEDLITKPVSVIMPNPKTSGVARLAVLCFWEARKRAGNADSANKDLKLLCNKVPVFDPSMRSCTTTFVQKGIGDVQISWEPEAWLEIDQSAGQLELIHPKLSFRIEPPIGMVAPIANAKGTGNLVRHYLNWLYTEKAQKILAQHHFRPVNEEQLLAHQNQFPQVQWLTINDIATDWNSAVDRFFSDNGLVDQALREAAKR